MAQVRAPGDQGGFRGGPPEPPDPNWAAAWAEMQRNRQDGYYTISQLQFTAASVYAEQQREKGDSRKRSRENAAANDWRESRDIESAADARFNAGGPTTVIPPERGHTMPMPADPHMWPEITHLARRIQDQRDHDYAEAQRGHDWDEATRQLGRVASRWRGGLRQAQPTVDISGPSPTEVMIPGQDAYGNPTTLVDLEPQYFNLGPQQPHFVRPPSVQISGDQGPGDSPGVCRMQ
jgi:hypothetical protein